MTKNNLGSDNIDDSQKETPKTMYRLWGNER